MSRKMFAEAAARFENVLAAFGADRWLQLDARTRPGPIVTCGSTTPTPDVLM